jgi:hypothetical protein
MRLVFLVILVLAMFSTSERLLAKDGAAAWNVDDIPWQATGANGTKFALLDGNREQPGSIFTYAFFIPAGVWDSPHWHSTTARVFVAKGALKIGYGDAQDHAQAQTWASGATIIVPGSAVHFDGADVDTIIVGVATGPWTTTYLDGSKPASAGTPIK